MVKCEVLQDCAITVKKGSIVEVSERQFEVARRFLKPLSKESAKKPLDEPKVEEVETTEKAKKKKK